MQFRNHHQMKNPFVVTATMFVSMLSLGAVAFVAAAAPIAPLQGARQSPDHSPTAAATESRTLVVESGNRSISIVESGLHTLHRLETTNANFGSSNCGEPTLTQSTTPHVITGAIACFDQGGTFENSYARSFTAPRNFEVGCVEFGVADNVGGAWPARVRLLTGGPITGPYANLTLLAESIINIPAGGAPTFYTAEFPSGVPVVAGSQIIVEINFPSRQVADGGDGGLITCGHNGNGQSAPSYIRAAVCGAPDFVDMASVGYPNAHLPMTVSGVATEIIGACCHLDANGVAICVVNHLGTCTSLGGIFHGIHTVCADYECDASQFGICCVDYPWAWDCQDSTTTPGLNQATCINGGGYWTSGGNCATTTCQVNYPECDPNMAVSNPSFETNQLLTYGAIYGNFALNQGTWGAESGTLVATGPVNVIPFGGTQLHRMNPNQGVVTQTVQVIDVSSLSVSIDAGLLAAEFGARFNVESNVNGAIAYSMLRFFQTNGTQITLASSGGQSVDSNPITWQRFAVNAAIPAGTHWLMVEVGFNNASLNGQPGFVDDTNLCIRPNLCKPDINVNDASFEFQQFVEPYAAVLNNFNLYQGHWGAENGAIVGAENSVTPATGSKMLRMNNDGLTVTQTVQVINLDPSNSHGAQIDAGLMEVVFSAMFNAHPNISAAQSQVIVRFYSGPSLSLAISNASHSLVLDPDPVTWQMNTLRAPVPATTRWMVMEVAYVNSTIGGDPGYVDDASICLRATAPPPPCPGDATFDGHVNVNDLLMVINAWGLCPKNPCPADVTGDGAVNVNDLLAVINNWGPCQ